MITIMNDGYDGKKMSIARAQGCYIYDKEGTCYIDTTLGCGTHILGHGNKVVVDALKEQLDIGMLYTTNNDVAYEVAELISQNVPNAERVIFCNSGSEATMRAARIARAYTKKNKVAIFSGSWHGGNELYMYDYDYTKEDYKTYHKSRGVPDKFKELVVVLPYNDEQAFEIIKTHHQELAMVIVEPSQGSNPRDDMKEYLQKLRALTKQLNIVLCFDEIITGFRVALGGGQEYYNIDADLMTYGKTLGGGLPIGAVAGRADIFATLQGSNQNLPVFMGGTFSANPLVMSSAKTVIKYLISNKENIYPFLQKNADWLKYSINEYCVENNIPVRVLGMNSMLRLYFTDIFVKSRQDRDKYEISYEKQNEIYFMLLKEKNIFVNSNRIIFLSLVHDIKIVQTIQEAILDVLNKFFKAC